MISNTFYRPKLESGVKATKWSPCSVYTSSLIKQTSDSIILEVFAYSRQPEVAVSVANAISKAFVIEMQNLLGRDAIQMLDSADDYWLNENGLKNLWKKRRPPREFMNSLK